MKNLISFLFFAFLLFQTNQLKACFCALQSFCESTTDSTSILEVEVIEKYSDLSGGSIDHYADVRIIGTLQNGITQDTITISGQLFTTCDDQLPEMEIGDTLLINFSDLIFPLESAKHPAFQLSICYTRILQLSSGIVTGNVQPNLNSMDYNDFVTNLDQCVDFVNSTDDLSYLENEITLSPNPFSENLNISFGNLPTSKISFELFSAQGQKVTSINNIETYNHSLDLSSLTHGVYFLKITYRQTFFVKRIVKI